MDITNGNIIGNENYAYCKGGPSIATIDGECACVPNAGCGQRIDVFNRMAVKNEWYVKNGLKKSDRHAKCSMEDGELYPSCGDEYPCCAPALFGEFDYETVHMCHSTEEKEFGRFGGDEKGYEFA
jgi:hypothetical protein